MDILITLYKFGKEGENDMEMTLNLPKNYSEIEEEEMMYLEGGSYWKHVGHAEWTYTFTRTDFNKIAAAVSLGTSVAAAIAKWAPDPEIKGLAGTIAAVGSIASAFFTYLGANTNGFRIYFHTMWWGRQPRWAQFI